MNKILIITGGSRGIGEKTIACFLQNGWHNIEEIGAHIAENKSRIDFIYDKNISFILESIMTQYNAIIARDQLIKTDLLIFKSKAFLGNRRFFKSFL